MDDDIFAALPTPIVLPLEARLAGGAGGDDGPALRFGGPGALAVELSNRTGRTLSLAPNPAGGFHVRLTLRPHTLRDLPAVRLDPASVEDGWTMSVADPARIGHRQELLFTAAEPMTVEPGGMLAIRLTGAAPDPFGGARGTQAAVDYADLTHGDSAAPLSGHLLARLALLEDEQRADGAVSARTGSGDATDMFLLHFVLGQTVIADGETENVVRLRLRNVSGRTLTMLAGRDDGPRFRLDYLGWHAFGLTGGGELAITEIDDAGRGQWEAVDDGQALAPLTDFDWHDSHEFDVVLRLRSDADLGVKPLGLRYENMPPDGQAAGTLTLLATLTMAGETQWDVNVVRPLRLRGAQGVVEFLAGPVTSGDVTAKLSTVNATEGFGRFDIEAHTGHGMRLAATRIAIDGPLEVSGALTALDALKAEVATVTRTLTADSVEAKDVMTQRLDVRGEVSFGGDLRTTGRLVMRTMRDSVSNARMVMTTEETGTTVQTYGTVIAGKRRGPAPPLLLNPEGGKVAIGTNETPGALTVKGELVADSLRVASVTLVNPRSGNLWLLEADDAGSLVLSDPAKNIRMVFSHDRSGGKATIFNLNN